VKDVGEIAALFEAVFKELKQAAGMGVSSGAASLALS
jgi:hypothetical protein